MGNYMMNKGIHMLIKFKTVAVLTFLLGVYGINAQNLEVDHLWIHIKSDSSATKIIENAGLKISKSSIQGNAKMIHSGQGTAGIYVRFENIYLEFILIENDSLLNAVAPELGSTLLGYPDTSPIGIGLSFTEDEPINLPFPTSSYWAEWMRPFDGLAVAKRNVSTDPAIFVIPQWLNWKKRTSDNPNILEDAKHPLGVSHVTKIRITGPNHPSKSEAVQLLIDRNLVEFKNGRSYLLELEFDRGGVNRLDLRPKLPLLLIY
jgi:hypothetical protein